MTIMRKPISVWLSKLLFAVSTMVLLMAGCAGHKALEKPVQSPAGSATPVSVPDNDAAAASRKDTLAALRTDSIIGLSPASQLLIKACNNYIEVNGASPKAIDVYQIKSSLFYTSRLFDSARAVYAEIIRKFAGTAYAFEAIRMTAQSYYEEKRFGLAGEWYKKLSEVSSDSTDKSEAMARIAESVFRLAEINETEGKFKEAAQEYERVALEHPDAKIADIALFNAGLNNEKLNEWSRAILMFERLLQKYADSKLSVKARFRIGKCHEKLQQWDLAAGAYLRIPLEAPKDELAPVAIYNAGFCFENGEKFREAAATFEKLVQLYPDADDAADVLFRAGELYGKVKDWDAAARVTAIFSKRFGNDENRIVQALCMSGVAQYMRNRTDDALRELHNAVATFKKLKDPGPMNAYYAAKALYTVGEIEQAAMAAISLGSQDKAYRRRLAEKSDKLDECISAYGGVIKFNLSEWTTRAVFQIGQAYEDFAIGIFSQERPSGISLDKRIALELGIAQAVDKYFVEKALAFHERNVKLGITEKIEDKYILQSRRKLTYLPYLAAENYLAIVEITRSARHDQKLDGFALIANRLELFQKIAPFQKRAIELYLQCLEEGTTYQERDEYYEKASASITGLSLSVGETYADVVEIARDAPIPSGFDDYEVFVYKTKLLRQIEGYENQALENYLKTIKIAEAYKLSDTSVGSAKQAIAKLLFNRGRCYDLLCINAFTSPPYPHNIDEAEREEYKARFEEIGLRFQEQAFDIYKNIIEFAEKSYAQGPYVTHAYIRLFQNFPDKYGVKKQQMVQTAISTGAQWKWTEGPVENWFTFACDDSAWGKAARAPVSTQAISGIPGNTPIPMWRDTGSGEAGSPPGGGTSSVLFRRTFTIDDLPGSAELYLAAQGTVSIYLNAERLLPDTALTFTSGAVKINLLGKLRRGRNLVAIGVVPQDMSGYGIYPLILLSSGTDVALPQPPGYDAPMAVQDAAVDKYVFPEIRNFTVKKRTGNDAR